MKKRLCTYPIVAILLAMALWVSTWDKTDPDEILFEKLSGPTVKITVWGTTINAEGAIIERKMGHGSGVIIAREKRAHFVLSAAHVYPPDCGFLKVEHPSYFGGKDAHVIELDRDNDLMLLVFVADTELPITTIATIEPSVTAEVFLYGHGAPAYAFATKGIVSAKQSAWFDAPEMWVISSQVWFGCSGGGAYNKDGEFIGIVTRIRISRGVPLPWQCGLVPMKEVKIFLKKAGLAVRENNNTKLAGSSAMYGSESWMPLFPIYSERQGSQ